MTYAKNSKQSYFITADDYSNKKAFAEDLRRNGYAVHYIATPYTIDAVSDSYNKRREYRNEVARNTRAAAKAHREAVAEMTAEELVEAVENLCARTANSRAEVDQMIEETEAMIKAQEKALEEARAKDRAAAEEARAAEAEEQTTAENSETYQAWVAMMETDVISEEYETLSEAVDEIETRYSKGEQKALGITYCRLLCTEKTWLECLEEKTVDDIYEF